MVRDLGASAVVRAALGREEASEFLPRVIATVLDEKGVAFLPVGAYVDAPSVARARAAARAERERPLECRSRYPTLRFVTLRRCLQGSASCSTTTHARGLRFRQINPKEAFTIVDQRGEFFRASLNGLGSDGGEALVYERMSGSTESPVEITLVCAVLARQRMLGVVQKATELGVVRIVPVLCERSVQRSGLAHEKAHAWPGQALRAARQCRRASVPDVRPPIPLVDALDAESFRAAARRFTLDDRARDAIDARSRATGVASVAFVVGPEGGFTDDERALLADRGATALRLGGRVLRAETAVLVGVSLIQQAFGDF